MKTFIALTSAALLTVSLVHAQAPTSNVKTSSYSAPKTPWGDPDLQGTYTNSNESGIPMSRPPELAGKKPEDVTPQEMARNELVKAIREAGREPVQRDSLYQPVARNGELGMANCELPVGAVLTPNSEGGVA